MKNLITIPTVQTVKKLTAFVALGLTTLTIASTAVAQNQQPRPFTSTSHVEVIINFREFPAITWTAVVTGTATHLGAYTAQSKGVLNVDFCEDPVTGDWFPCFYTPVGAGVLTAANGDTLSNTFANPGNSPEGGVMTFIGGTGRFENAIGSGIQTQFNILMVDNGDGTSTLTYDDIIQGTITY